MGDIQVPGYQRRQLPPPPGERTPHYMLSHGLAQQRGIQELGEAISGFAGKIFEDLVQTRVNNEIHDFLGIIKTTEEKFSSWVESNPGASFEDMAKQRDTMIAEINQAGQNLSLPDSKQYATNWYAKNEKLIRTKAQSVVERVVTEHERNRFQLRRKVLIEAKDKSGIKDLYPRMVESNLLDSETANLMKQIDLAQIDGLIAQDTEALIKWNLKKAVTKYDPRDTIQKKEAENLILDQIQLMKQIGIPPAKIEEDIDGAFYKLNKQEIWMRALDMGYQEGLKFIKESKLDATDKRTMGNALSYFLSKKTRDTEKLRQEQFEQIWQGIDNADITTDQIGEIGTLLDSEIEISDLEKALYNRFSVVEKQDWKIYQDLEDKIIDTWIHPGEKHNIHKKLFQARYIDKKFNQELYEELKSRLNKQYPSELISEIQESIKTIRRRHNWWWLSNKEAEAIRQDTNSLFDKIDKRLEKGDMPKAGEIYTETRQRLLFNPPIYPVTEEEKIGMLPPDINAPTEDAFKRLKTWNDVAVFMESVRNELPEGLKNYVEAERSRGRSQMDIFRSERFQKWLDEYEKK